MSDEESCNPQSIPAACAPIFTADCTGQDPARTSTADLVARLRGVVVR